MPFKFENLDVWKMSIDYCDPIYQLAEMLPEKEEQSAYDSDEI